MLPGKKKRMTEAIKAGFGQNPLQTTAAGRCRERLDQIRVFHDILRKTEDPAD